MIPVPNLDTIAFDALVEEGRALIPRYAPDWTDHNLHDPGITLLDLLAWVVDRQVYRLGFVGDAHLKAFAALLGVRRCAARPARGLIWPSDAAIPAGQALQAGTRAWPIHQPELVFTTEAAIRMSGASIAEITASAGDKTLLVHRDRGGRLAVDRDTDTLTLGLDRALIGARTSAFSLALGMEFSDVPPDLGPAVPLPVAFAYRTGDGVWHPARVRWMDGGVASSGVALIEIAAQADRVSALRLDLSGFAVRMRPVRLALDAVPLVQVETLPETVVGRSSGLPDVEVLLGPLSLPAAESARHPLRIRTDEAGEAVKWHRVDDLAASGPGDRHYVFDETRGAIRFGNGVNGRVPPAQRDILRDALDVTLGAAGNLAADVSWRVEGLAARHAAWTNLEPMAGGADAWDREALLAALLLRSRSRSAMLRDAELRKAAADLRGFGVERAEVLPRFLPTLPKRPVPGARTLLLHPRAGMEGSDAWVDAIAGRLAPRRVLGERLSLVAAEPVAIAVSLELLIAAGSDAPAIEKAVRERLEARLSPSRKCPEIDPWPSGRPVTIGELEALVAAVKGVLAVPRLRLGGRGDAPEQVSVPLSPIEVASAGAIVVTWRIEA